MKTSIDELLVEPAHAALAKEGGEAVMAGAVADLESHDRVEAFGLIPRRCTDGSRGGAELA